MSWRPETYQRVKDIEAARSADEKKATEIADARSTLAANRANKRPVEHYQPGIIDRLTAVALTVLYGKFPPYSY